MSEKDVLRLNRPPPPLPPRAPSHQQSLQSPPADAVPIDAPPAYDSIFTRPAGDVRPPLGASDPRTSSTQSLVPTKSGQHSDKRRLLLIYVHGFMGDETSFQSFPAHVHHLVSALIAETHVVHTKIYPKYRSKKNIQFARDDFSRWLNPHEAPETDVILLGHSMGGLVSAEVALSQLEPGTQMRHRILGTINFDVPFLGMHPSVIKSGLASIFSPAPESSKPQPAGSDNPMFPPTSHTNSGTASTAAHASTPPALPPRRTDTLFNPEQPDPNYNPAFENDVRLPVRKGWRSAWHFVSKHNGDLINSTKELLKSHMEFGSAMADYSGLKNRYCRIRALEEENPDVRRSIMGAESDPPRVRFVNYYTSSTGRPKKVKSPAATPNHDPVESASLTTKKATEGPHVEPESSHEPIHAKERDPLVVNEGDNDTQSSHYDLEESNDAIIEAMDELEPLPMSDFESSDTESWADAVEDHVQGLKLSDTSHPDSNEPGANTSTEEVPTPVLSPVPSSIKESTSELTTQSSTNESTPSLTPAASSVNESTVSLSTTASLPPIQDAPPKPVEPDFSLYIDKETRKLAEKDYNRVLKTWERAVKDREKAVREREKLEDKRQRAAIKAGKQAERNEEKVAKQKEKEREKEAKKKEQAQENTIEEKFAIQRRETEREWKEALEMKWNDEDGTVTPMASTTASVIDSTRPPSLAPTTSTGTQSLSAIHAEEKARAKAEAEAAKPPKEHNFCSLPPKDSSGNRDPTWVKVFMPNVDEVGAHCGLFFETSPAYEQLVGDVGEKISEWTVEAESIRVAEELEWGPD